MTKFLSILLLNISWLLTSSLFAGEELIQANFSLFKKKEILASLETQGEDLCLRTLVNPIECENKEQLAQQTTTLKVTKAPLNYKGVKEDALFINFYCLNTELIDDMVESKPTKPFHPTYSVAFITLSSPENLQHSKTIHNLVGTLDTLSYPLKTDYLYFFYIESISTAPGYGEQGFSQNSIKHFLKILTTATINNQKSPPILVAANARVKTSQHIFQKLQFTKTKDLCPEKGFEVPSEFNFFKRRKGISHIIGINTQHIPALKAITVTKEEG